LTNGIFLRFSLMSTFLFIFYSFLHLSKCLPISDNLGNSVNPYPAMFSSTIWIAGRWEWVKARESYDSHWFRSFADPILAPDLLHSLIHGALKLCSIGTSLIGRPKEELSLALFFSLKGREWKSSYVQDFLIWRQVWRHKPFLSFEELDLLELTIMRK
jgi:hypothetical protein